MRAATYAERETSKLSTVSGTNIEEMPDVVDLIVKHKVDIFAFGRYCSTSKEKYTGIASHVRGRKAEIAIGCSPIYCRDFLDKIWHKYEEYKKQGVNIYSSLKDYLWTLYLYEEGIFKIPESSKKRYDL